MYGNCKWCNAYVDDGFLIPYDEEKNDFFRICFDCEESHTKEEVDKFIESVRKSEMISNEKD